MLKENFKKLYYKVNVFFYDLFTSVKLEFNCVPIQN